MDRPNPIEWSKFYRDLFVLVALTKLGNIKQIISL